MSYPLGNGGVGAQVSWGAGFARSAAEAMYPQLWDGLIGAWFPILGATGPTLHDVSGRGPSGANVNSPIYVASPFGPPVRLNGSNQYVSIPEATMPAPPDITMWVRVITREALSNSIGVFKWFFARNEGGGNDGDIGITWWPLTTDRLSFFIQDGVGTSVVNGTDTTIASGTLLDIVGTRDANIMRMYVNGVEDGTPVANPVEPGPLLSRAWAFGADNGTAVSGAEHMQMDLLAGGIWSRALPASQVKLLASRPDALIARPNDLAMQIAAMRGSVVAGGGPFPHYTRRRLAGGMIRMAG